MVGTTSFAQGQQSRSGALPRVTRLGRHATRPALRAPAAGPRRGVLSATDFVHLDDAASIADMSAGLTAPHPNAGCLLITRDGVPAARTFQLAQGTAAAEVLAVSAARDAARGATAYLNLECGDCHGDDSAVRALIQAGVSRVVVGLRHPLPHLRGKAIESLQSHGVAVDVLSDEYFESLPSSVDSLFMDGASSSSSSSGGDALGCAREATMRRCLSVNDALLHRAVLRRPLSILKYAMTLDGKIATAQVRGCFALACT